MVRVPSNQITFGGSVVTADLEQTNHPSPGGGRRVVRRVWLNGNGSGRLLFSCTQLVWEQ
jgi:hypothetical protein